MTMKRYIAMLLLAIAAPSAAFAQDACPKVSLEGPSKPVPAGRPVVFKTKVTPPGPYGYAWSLSAGMIANGQYTPAISVQTPPGSTVTATVQIVGLDKACETTWSASAVTAASSRRAVPKTKP